MHKKGFKIESFKKNEENTEEIMWIYVKGKRSFLIVEEFSRRCFFRNHLITFLNDELYSQTKVLVKKISIFENSGRGRPKNDDFWHFRE